MKLANKKTHPSIHRIKVLGYLIKNPCPPAVDQIFRALQIEISTLSKTTVYNILNLFLEAGPVMVLTIEDNKTRCDIITKTHGHFKCEECATISDFNTAIGSIVTEELSGFKVIDSKVCLKGICPKCL